IEEQFYLVWPLIVYFAAIKNIKHVIVAAIALAPLFRLSIYLMFGDLDAGWLGRAIYSLPFSQVDAFASGAAIAVCHLDKLQFAGRWLCASIVTVTVGGACVLGYQHLVYKAAIKGSFGYSMFLLPGYGFVWGYSLLNLVSGAFLIAAVQRLPA